jgi:hypothetical protein
MDFRVFNQIKGPIARGMPVAGRIRWCRKRVELSRQCAILELGLTYYNFYDLMTGRQVRTLSVIDNGVSLTGHTCASDLLYSRWLSRSDSVICGSRA